MAYDLMLQARAIGFGTSRKSNQEVRALMKRAIEIDPSYGTAYALLAEAIYARVALGWTGIPAQEAEQGEAYARKAITLAPNEPDGHRALGRYHLLRAEYEQAKHALERAIEINPSDSNALALWGAIRMFSGNPAGAIEVLELALKYDPSLEPIYVFDLSLSYYFAKRHQDALRMAERGLSQFPNFSNFYVVAAAAAGRLGVTARATQYVTEVRRRLPFLDLDQFGSRLRDPAHLAYLKDGLKMAGLQEP